MSANETIANRYRLEQRLGAGGMSTVRLAFDQRLEREVAVKLLAEHLADDPQFVSRFKHEALSAARLVHPNIVQVFDFGFDEATERYYIVMEYIHGRSGAELLKERGRLPLNEALDLLHGACQGLDYAHRNGVIHRDVKPGNILRSDEGNVKLADFGIAKAADASNITQAGAVLGTAAYLAPEQAHGEEAGPAADIYSLGVVAYQLISGHLPYEAKSLTELVLMQQEEQPARLDEFVPGVSAQLAQAVDRSLELNPEDRFRSTEAFRVALFAKDDGAAQQPTSATTIFSQDAETKLTRPIQRSVTDTDEHRTHTQVAGRSSASRRQQPRPPRREVRQAQHTGDFYSSAEHEVQQRTERRARRAFGRLFLLIVCAALGAGATLIATSKDQTAVKLRRVGGDTANEVVDEITKLIDSNTQ